MTTFNNSKLRARATPAEAGALYVDRQITDLANADQFPTVPASGDSIQIGVVPAGCKLVPQLCTIQVPILDSNGAPTVKYKIGSVATAAALAAEKTPGAAVSVVATTDFIVAAAGFGSPTDDVPIYLNLSAARATATTIGKILADLALRAWDSELDS